MQPRSQPPGPGRTWRPGLPSSTHPGLRGHCTGAASSMPGAPGPLGSQQGQGPPGLEPDLQPSSPQGSGACGLPRETQDRGQSPPGPVPTPPLHPPPLPVGLQCLRRGRETARGKAGVGHRQASPSSRLERGLGAERRSPLGRSAPVMPHPTRPSTLTASPIYPPSPLP